MQQPPKHLPPIPMSWALLPAPSTLPDVQSPGPSCWGLVETLDQVEMGPVVDGCHQASWHGFP